MSEKKRIRLVYLMFIVFLMAAILPQTFQSLYPTLYKIKTPVLLTCDSVWNVVRSNSNLDQDGNWIPEDERQFIIQIPLTYIQNLSDVRQRS